MKKSELKKIIEEVIKETLAKEQVDPIIPRAKGLDTPYNELEPWQKPGAGPHIGSKKSKAKPTKKRNLFRRKLEQSDPVIPDVDHDIEFNDEDNPGRPSTSPVEPSGRPDTSPRRSPKPRVNKGGMTMAQQKRRQYFNNRK